MKNSELITLLVAISGAIVAVSRELREWHKLLSKKQKKTTKHK